MCTLDTEKKNQVLAISQACQPSLNSDPFINRGCFAYSAQSGFQIQSQIIPITHEGLCQETNVKQRESTQPVWSFGANDASGG